MSNIQNLQNAIYKNLDSLRDLYTQAEGLSELISKVTDTPLQKDLQSNYDKVIDTFDKHIDTTDTLIKALKKVLED